MTEPRHPRFLKFLLGLKDDRAALATLRRGLGKPPGQRVLLAASLVQKHVPDDAYPSQRDAYYLVATLFALNPHHRPGRTIARAFRESRPEAAEDSQDRRVRALLNADPEDLPVHLRHLVTLLAGREEPFDWDQLLSDCLRWSHPERYAQLAWARDYWSSTFEAPANA